MRRPAHWIQYLSCHGLESCRWILGIGQRIAVEHIISGMRYPQHGSAIEMLEAELWDLSAGKAPSAQLVRVDHTALALSKTFI
ncbi:uncharacterized protein LOC131217202 isoform X5 [Magnolia sinica]|nr:uncharacterized protein LOC131217202 isoform X5 [Magnolia sinica]